MRVRIAPSYGWLTCAAILLALTAHAQTTPATQGFPAPQSDSLHGPGTIAPLPPKSPKTAAAENITVTGHRSAPAPVPHAVSQQLTTPTNAFNRSMNPTDRPADCKSDWVDVGGQPASPADIGTVEGAHACDR